MTSISRPLAGLLLLAAASAASGADTGAAADIAASDIAALTPIDQTGAGAGAGADSFAARYLTHGVGSDKGQPGVLAALDAIRAGGWSAGVSSARADGRAIDNGLAAVRSYAAYGASFGPVGLDASVNYYSYPGARRGVTGPGYDYAELSAGVRYGVFSARYNTTLSRDFFGLPDARGSSYLDLGIHRDLGHATHLALHAGDGRVAGSGNGIWDWRDLKAGLNRKLDSGWLLALNYTRAYGAAGPYGITALPGARSDGRPAFLNAGRRALVLSMARSF